MLRVYDYDYDDDDVLWSGNSNFDNFVRIAEVWNLQKKLKIDKEWNWRKMSMQTWTY